MKSNVKQLPLESFEGDEADIKYIERIPLPGILGLDDHALEKNLPFGIMAFTGNGKTIFAENLATQLLIAGKRVTILANENPQARSDYIVNVFRITYAFKNGISLTMDECSVDPLRSQIASWYAKTKEFRVYDVAKYADYELVRRVGNYLAEDRNDILILDYLQNTTRYTDAKRFACLHSTMSHIKALCAVYGRPIGVVAQAGRKGNSRNGAPDSDACEGCPQFEKDLGMLFTLKDPKSNVRNHTAFKDFVHLRIAKARFGPCKSIAIGIDYKSRFMNGALSQIEIEDYFKALKVERKQWPN